MSDLFVNPHPRFGRWVLARGLLRTPFVLADIGVQGGISQRWSHLEGHLIVHGFDPLEETIEPLRRKALPGHHYHAIALGNEDGERDLHVPDISFASSFYAGVHETGLANPAGISSNARARRVPIRRLDGLVSSGAQAGTRRAATSSLCRSVSCRTAFASPIWRSAEPLIRASSNARTNFGGASCIGR